MNGKKFKIFVGSNNFQKMIVGSDVFVDKSIFIKEVIDNGEEATLITKARRWGKTLNLDILKTFLSIDVDEQGNPKTTNSNKVLFEGGKISLGQNTEKQLDKLAIAKVDDGSYMSYQGQYPVIFFSFKDVTGNTLQEVESKLDTRLKELYREYSYLEKSTKISSYEKADLQKYFEGKVSQGELVNSIRFLSNLLHKHHNQKVYILVDEYDKPVNSLLETGITKQDKNLIKEAANLVTSILSACGKDNPHLEKIILTGMFDTLKKESGSGFNNVKVYGVNDIKYSKSFGFSEEEVNQLVAKLEFGEKEELVKQNIKDWYNGYTVPISVSKNIQVYTPWAVMSYLSAAYNENNFQPENYWSKSGASVILQSLLKAGAISAELSQKFSLITQDNAVKLAYDKSTSLFGYEFTPGEYNDKLFTYLLVNSGYLTVREEDSEYFFSIPNYEVKREFLGVLENEIQNTEKAIQTMHDSGMLGILTHHRDVLIKHIKLLQYENRVIQAFEAIASKGNDELNKIFSSVDMLKCEGDDFNFFHIGAIMGDKNVFKTLTDKCDKSLLSSRDKIQDLKPIDYAYLSGNHEIMNLLAKQYNSSISLQTPGTINSVICAPVGGLYILYNLLTVSAVTAAFKIALKAPGFKWAFIGVATTSIVKEFTKYIGDGKFGLCEQYNNYAKVDTSSPDKFNSLKQFEKYSLEHKTSYMSVDMACKDSYKEIANISISIPGEEQNKVTFSLCETPPEPIDYASYLLNTILISGGVMAASLPVMLVMSAYHGNE